MTDAKARVEAGMAWLDERFPGHVERFNPDDFHIMCVGNKSCALMQAADQAEYEDACRVTGLDYDSDIVIGLGFYPRHEDEWILFNADEEDLNAMWLQAYAERIG